MEESPVFTEIAERRERTRMPIVQVFRKHWLLVIVAALVFAGNNAVGYMTTGGYIQNYATNPEGPLKLDRGPVLWAVAGLRRDLAGRHLVRGLAERPHRPAHHLHHRAGSCSSSACSPSSRW